jgi:hypothetical protein
MDRLGVFAALALMALSLSGCGSGGGSGGGDSCSTTVSITDPFHPTKNMTVAISFTGLDSDCCTLEKEHVHYQPPTVNITACDNVTNVTEQQSINGGSCSGKRCKTKFRGVDDTFYGISDMCCEEIQTCIAKDFRQCVGNCSAETSYCIVSKRPPHMPHRHHTTAPQHHHTTSTITTITTPPPLQQTKLAKKVLLKKAMPENTVV